jgi:hypothetical protein
MMIGSIRHLKFQLLTKIFSTTRTENPFNISLTFRRATWRACGHNWQSRSQLPVQVMQAEI